MEHKNISDQAGALIRTLKKNKFIAAALILGIVLLLIPTGGGSGNETVVDSEQLMQPDFLLEEQEEKIAAVLAKIDGVGKISVVLTLEAGSEREVITDEEITDSGDRTTTVTAQNGTGKYDAVTRRYLYPQYQGALIVCEGGANASIKLQITQAVAALTGLGTDRITVAKMK